MMKAIADIQEDPSNQRAYRELCKIFRDANRINEAEAIEELVRRRFGGPDCFHGDQGQQRDDPRQP